MSFKTSCSELDVDWRYNKNVLCIQANLVIVIGNTDALDIVILAYCNC